MAGFRQHLLRRRWLAAWLVTAALLLKLLVPSGYMLDVSGGGLTVELCSGHGPMRMAVPMPGMARHGDKRDGAKAEQPCAFSGLTAPALAGADPLLLALAIAFIVAAAFRVVVRPVRARNRHLRPPLRGPPPSC